MRTGKGIRPQPLSGVKGQEGRGEIGDNWDMVEKNLNTVSSGRGERRAPKREKSMKGKRGQKKKEGRARRRGVDTKLGPIRVKYNTKKRD